MDYFVLTTKDSRYYCVNHVTRCKSADGDDVIRFVCSGIGGEIAARNVAGIFTQTVALGSTV